MPAYIDGDVLRALAKVTRDDSGAMMDAQKFVHLRPDPENPNRMIGESTDGRVVLWTSLRGEIDADVVIPKRDCERFDKGETATITLVENPVPGGAGAHIVHPFGVALPRVVPTTDNDAEVSAIRYPDLEEMRPDVAQKVAFDLPGPESLTTLGGALKALGCKSVQVLLPKRAGAPVAFRALSATGDVVEAVVLPESMFSGSDPLPEQDAKPDAAPPKALPCGDLFVGTEEPAKGLPAPEILDTPAAAPAAQDMRCPSPATGQYQVKDGPEIPACEDHAEDLRPAAKHRPRWTALGPTDGQPVQCGYVYRFRADETEQ